MKFVDNVLLGTIQLNNVYNTPPHPLNACLAIDTKLYSIPLSKIIPSYYSTYRIAIDIHTRSTYPPYPSKQTTHRRLLSIHLLIMGETI